MNIPARFGCLAVLAAGALAAPGTAALTYYDVEHFPIQPGVTKMVYSSATDALVYKDSGSAVVAVDLPTRQATLWLSNFTFTDLALSPSERYVFVADYGGENFGYSTPLNISYVHRIDLTTLGWETRSAFVAGHVQAVSDTQVVLKSLDQWVTFTNNAWGSGAALTVLNTSSGFPWDPAYYASVYFGNFQYDIRSGRLLHGNSGSSSQEIQAFRLVNNDFATQESSGIYGSAQGFGGSVVLANDGSALYYGRLQVDPLEVTHNLRAFPELILAANSKVALSATGYYDAATGNLLGLLPFVASAFAVNPTGDDFWAYDPLTSIVHHFATAPSAQARLRLGADFNADARNDLVWYDSATGRTALWMMNGGQPGQTANILANAAWRVAFKAGFNAGDQTDLLWHNSATGEWVIWLMNGPNFAGGGGILTDPNWNVTHVGDFNGDGKADLVWRNAATGATASWLMDGTTFVGGAGLLSDGNWRVTHVADFDGDGKSDLLWHNDVSGETVMWLMNGTAITGGWTIMNNPSWSVTHVGDFNADGRADLVWRNAATGETAVWLMNGVAITSGTRLLNDPNWRVAHVADLNGDGSSDLVWTNASTGETAAWLMNGTALASGGRLLYSADWTVVATGDYNGDGKADLLWHNTLTGSWVVWLMDGLAPTAGYTQAAPPSYVLQ